MSANFSEQSINSAKIMKTRKKEELVAKISKRGRKNL
jgi:hypothetical protein